MIHFENSLQDRERKKRLVWAGGEHRNEIFVLLAACSEALGFSGVLPPSSLFLAAVSL